MPPDSPPQGTQTQPGQGDDAPKYVTEEQLNRAITARLKDFGQKLEKTVTESLTTTLGTKLDELRATLAPTIQAGGGDAKPKTIDAADLENHPIVKGLKKTVEDQRAFTEQLKTERDKEKREAREAKKRTRVTEELTKGGVDPRYVDHAFARLSDRVRHADDDTDDLVFREAGGDIDFETGLKTWLKSDDAKIYLPARGTQGSGDPRNGKRPPAPGTAPTREPGALGRSILAMVNGMPLSGSQGSGSGET